MVIEISVAGFDKKDLALVVALAFVFIFAFEIIYLFTTAEIDFKIGGTLDVNVLMVVFVAIVNSVIIFLGIRRIDSQKAGS